MTQIGVGIGTNKSPTKTSADKQNHKHRKADPAVGNDDDDEDPQNLLAQSVVNTQNSSNSSEQRRNGAADDDNSNSFESHSDFDLNPLNEKQARISDCSTDKSSRTKNRHGMSVNWGNNAAAMNNVTSTENNGNRQARPNRPPSNQKHTSNVKFFATTMANSLYRNPMRLSGLGSTAKCKASHPTVTSKNVQQLNCHSPIPTVLTSIPSEPELSPCRAYPPPQPRPESLAIMSEELFHERLKARQSPLFSASSSHGQPATLGVNNNLTTNFSSTSSFLLDKHCIEDVTYSTTNQNATSHVDASATASSEHDEEQPSLVQNNNNDNLIELVKQQGEENQEEYQAHAEQDQDQDQEHAHAHEQEQVAFVSITNQINVQSSAESSDESWRLLNSNSSLDEQIPYIDDTDFEDLGKQRLLIIFSRDPQSEHGSIGTRAIVSIRCRQ
jgi:hypothetical protein